jgi:hypothetical protein
MNADHPATMPYRLTAWSCRYLPPDGGVLLDPSAGDEIPAVQPG